jgi:hypothetical protein
MATDLFARLVKHWGPCDRETFEERAAIMEFDGGIPRDKAEAMAYKATLINIEARNTQRGKDSNGNASFEPLQGREHHH